MLAKDIEDGTDVALKIVILIKIFQEDNLQKRSFLSIEIQIYKKLKGTKGFPTMRWYGVEGDNNILVMDMLGPSLEILFRESVRNFSEQTVVKVAIQLVTFLPGQISRLKRLHRIGYLHRDIKSDNFVVGTGANKDLIYLIDFGLSKLYIDPMSGKHIQYSESNLLMGTAKFVSINTHLGIEQSRRDDLEALGYVLIYLSKSGLPWHQKKGEDEDNGYVKIMNLKMGTPLDELCEGIPAPFFEYMNYCKKLQFEETPNYSYLKRLFKEYVYKNNYQEIEFDWNRKEDSKKMNLSIVKFVQGITSCIKPKKKNEYVQNNTKATLKHVEDETPKYDDVEFGFVPNIMKSYQIKDPNEDSEEDILIPNESSENKIIELPKTIMINEFNKWGKGKNKIQSNCCINNKAKVGHSRSKSKPYSKLNRPMLTMPAKRKVNN